MTSSQETWLRLYRHIGSVRDPQALGAWLGTTASRESLRALAGDRREEPTDEETGRRRRGADDVATRWRGPSAAWRSSARWGRSRRATAR